MRWFWAFKPLNYASRFILLLIVLNENLTRFVKTATKVDLLISMNFHFLTYKKGPVEFLNIVHHLKVFSLFKESLKAGISSFKILNFQIIICFDLVISCIKLEHRSRWSGSFQCIGKQWIQKMYVPCWVSINSSPH